MQQASKEYDISKCFLPISYFWDGSVLQMKAEMEWMSSCEGSDPCWTKPHWDVRFGVIEEAQGFWFFADQSFQILRRSQTERTKWRPFQVILDFRLFGIPPLLDLASDKRARRTVWKRVRRLRMRWQGRSLFNPFLKTCHISPPHASPLVLHPTPPSPSPHSPHI
jgi:hypothetical protein